MVPTHFGTGDQRSPWQHLEFFAVNPVTFFTPTILLLHRYLVTLWQSVLHTPCSPSRLDPLPAPRSPSLSLNETTQTKSTQPTASLLNDLVLTVQ